MGAATKFSACSTSTPHSRLEGRGWPRPDRAAPTAGGASPSSLPCHRAGRMRCSPRRRSKTPADTKEPRGKPMHSVPRVRAASGAALALAAALVLMAPTPAARAAEPITLSIIDTGGDLTSTQAIIENYKKANPQKVRDIKLQRAPAPEVPAKIKAQQDAGRLDINLILTGQDGGSLLAANGQLIKLFPTYEKRFPESELTDAGKAL